MYYALVFVSVAMFGGCFALQDVYRKMRGSSLSVSMESALLGSAAGLIVLLTVNGFTLDTDLRTIFLASLAAINGLAFTFFAFKALDTINLSLFSMFSMLGGMVLPFLYGTTFGHEKPTGAKIICVLFIFVALMTTVTRSQKGEKKKIATLYYAGIFVLNGTAGVLSTIYAAPLGEGADTSGYYIWNAIITMAFAAIVLLFRIKKKEAQAPFTFLAGIVGALRGGINHVANWFLTITLAGGVAASIQYPIITGGVMIVSTLICFFGPRKPSKKELIAVALASIGLAALLLPF